MEFAFQRITETGLIMRLFTRLLLATALCAVLSNAQEPSVIVKSLDDLEKRIVKVETDLGKLKKSQVANVASERISARPDSSLPRIRRGLILCLSD